MDIKGALSRFTGGSDLFDASIGLFERFGIRFTIATRKPVAGGFPAIYSSVRPDEKMPKDAASLLHRVSEVYFIGSVSDDTLSGGASALDAVKDSRYKGMIVFAVDVAPGQKPLTRTEIASLTRIANRCARDNPVTVVFRDGPSLSIATCERTAYRQAWRAGERLGKVSILKDVNCCSPHRGHIDILESMDVKGCRTFDALYARWQKVFSTSILTNKFYNELFDWYVWAIDPETDVYFPNDPDDDNDDYEGRDTKIIRLITRIMFVWFIRQKKLVPDWIFDAEYLKSVLKDFDPTSADSGSYYNAVLQNLFFATLNRAIEDEDGKRRFAELQGHVDAKNLYRYDELYTISKDEIVEHFASIPFVNGSLFECLDKTKGNDGVGKAFYYDGFSRNDSRIPATNHYRYRAFVPNSLFFDPERGLFSIFDRYNFTIEENTPLEQQIALDPELLGKVFENLLGVYNSETKETARKQSGSFYTPREIVDYMVDETLIAYLGDTKLVRNLFSESFVYNELDWAEYQNIAAKLKTVKILDPACGSGAFPVGMLNRIVEILGKLKTDGGDVFKLKRHIIENCIYGSDIQCIAAQITKLRFFISLIVNCDRDETKPNFGIPELPNLETKFVAANSLIGVAKIEKGQDLFENPKVVDITEALRKVRHDHFNANTATKKRRLVKKDADLRQKLFNELNGNFFQQKDADKLALWNPYDQNTSADFFDPEWMFGIKDGFDIVIGNPPYIQLQANRGKLGEMYKNCGFETFSRTGDLYCLFYEKGIQVLRPKGYLCYITSNKWMRAGYGDVIRKFFTEKTTPKLLIDFAGEQIFESATVDTNILLLEKSTRSSDKTLCCIGTPECRKDLCGFVQGNSIPCTFSSAEPWVILSPIEQSIKWKISATGTPLKDWGVKIYRGVLTGFTDAFIINKSKREEILARCDPIEKELTNSLIVPVLRGRDIERYGYTWAGLYMLNTHNGYDNLPRIDVKSLPSLKQHLDEYIEQITKRYDKGDTPYNLRNCAYVNEFAKPKIAWARLSRISKKDFEDFPRFAKIPEGYFLVDSLCFFTGSNLDVLEKLLNSRYAAYYFFNSVATLDAGGLQMRQQFVENIPLPKSLLTKTIENVDVDIFNAFGFNESEVKYITDFLEKKKQEISRTKE